MQLSITKADLMRALTSARSVVPNRSTIPIIGNVRLIANGNGRLDLSGTDLDRQCSDSGPAMIGTQGAVTVPADIMLQAVKAMPSGDVHLSLDASNGRLEMRSGRTKYRLATMPADDFPELARDQAHVTLTLPCAVAARLLAETVFAADTERHYLAGVRLDTPANTRLLRATCTDSHRLVAFVVGMPDGAAAMPSGIIIPRGAQADIGRLADADGDMTISIAGTRVVIDVGATRYTSKLVDGIYPDTDRVIPPLDGMTITKIRRADLTEAAGRMLAVLDSKSPAISIEVAGGELKLACRRGHDHEAEDAIACDASGDDWIDGISARYLADQLGVMRGEWVEIIKEKPGAPYRFVDDGDVTAVHVIMPMRY